MGLISDLEAKDKKGVFRGNDEYVTYPTGILPLDYANGFWQTITDSEGNVRNVPSLGIMGGTFGQVIGTTGSGKSTFAMQLGYSIIRKFEDGVMYYIDTEKTALRQRVIQITGADYDDPRIKIIKTATTIEDVLNLINDICNAKEAGGNAYKYKIEDRSFNGKPMEVYVPTVFIIDSLPAFNSKDYNVEDLGNNIDQMRAAKDVTRFYTNCLDRAWYYNISFIVVNHIRPKADTNPYAAPPRGLMMLGPQETLPRGSVAQFYSQWVIRINSKKSDSYTLDDNGFKGYKCIFELAKSKQNTVGVKFPVAFISDVGYDPVYTLYEFAQEIGIISGRNPYLYFEGLDTFKFNRKDFRRKFVEEQPFREAVLSILRPYLEGLLSDQPEILSAEDKSNIIRFGDISLNY